MEVIEQLQKPQMVLNPAHKKTFLQTIALNCGQSAVFCPWMFSCLALECKWNNCQNNLGSIQEPFNVELVATDVHTEPRGALE